MPVIVSHQGKVYEVVYRGDTPQIVYVRKRKLPPAPPEIYNAKFWQRGPRPPGLLVRRVIAAADTKRGRKSTLADLPEDNQTLPGIFPWKKPPIRRRITMKEENES